MTSSGYTSCQYFMRIIGKRCCLSTQTLLVPESWACLLKEDSISAVLNKAGSKISSNQLKYVTKTWRIVWLVAKTSQIRLQGVAQVTYFLCSQMSQENISNDLRTDTDTGVCIPGRWGEILQKYSPLQSHYSDIRCKVHRSIQAGHAEGYLNKSNVWSSLSFSGCSYGSNVPLHIPTLSCCRSLWEDVCYAEVSDEHKPTK